MKLIRIGIMKITKLKYITLEVKQDTLFKNQPKEKLALRAKKRKLFAFRSNICFVFVLVCSNSNAMTTMIMREGIVSSSRQVRLLHSHRDFSHQFSFTRSFSSSRLGLIQPEFQRNVIRRSGIKGQDWLQSLPDITNYLCHKWQLSNPKPFHKRSHDYILSAYRKHDNLKVMLKIGVPGSELLQEVISSRVYSGNGCMPLLDYDNEVNALLREQVEPGITLKSLFPHKEQYAIHHTVNIIRQLHSNRVFNKSEIPTINDWLNQINRNTLLPPIHLKKAIDLSKILLDSQDDAVLLHGDLHHGNILYCRKRGWIAIDPKGIIGEPAYEVGAFIRNPMPNLLRSPKAHKIIAHRIKLFSTQLALSERRIKDWSYVQAVLAACWAEEDGSDFLPWLRCAELLGSVDIYK